MTFQRIVQSLSLAAFVVLLTLAAFPRVSPVTVDIFIALDPVVFLGTCLSDRVVVPALWTGALMLALTPLLGRFFCSTLCPMGTTLDVTDRFFRATQRPPKKTAAWRPVKYHLLLFTLGAALLGISFVFLAAPLSLITRLYALILNPMICHATAKLLAVLTPLAEQLDLPALSYYRVAAPRYTLQWVTVLLFAGIFAGALAAPRFWCRNLCPAGAAFALLSRHPLLGRRVSDACTDCGICQQQCPMEAIGTDAHATNHGECIVCETCVRACPTRAITFNRARPRAQQPAAGVSMGRRQWLGGALAGVGAAIITRTTLEFPRVHADTGQVSPPNLVRPPGALPEFRFLSRCLRCGACMKACPTNTLQPLGLAAGFAAFFSPEVVARRGPCEPACNVCGQVCPTGAIRTLAASEKIWAKIGTAAILRHRCLAWEFDRKCLVCDEVCPYGAISLKKVAGIRRAVPFVDETRCSGCGYCETHCPVQNRSAIVVSPLAAFRIATGSYREAAQLQGYKLRLKEKGSVETSPPAFSNGLPPGFTP